MTMAAEWLTTSKWTAEELHGKTVQILVHGIPAIGRIEVEPQRDGRVTIDVVDREGKESRMGFSHFPLTQESLNRLIKSPNPGRPDFIVT